MKQLLTFIRKRILSRFMQTRRVLFDAFRFADCAGNFVWFALSNGN